MMNDGSADGMQQLYDIYGLWHVPWWQAPWVWYCLVVSGLLLVGWYVTRRIMMRRRAHTPWGTALMALDTLKAQGLISVVYSKEFYTALTKIFKTYLQERYGLDVAGKTDDEVLELLERSPFPPDLLSPLRIIFKGSITIKFAKAQAIKDQIEQDFVASRVIIDKTIPNEK